MNPTAEGAVLINLDGGSVLKVIFGQTHGLIIFNMGHKYNLPLNSLTAIRVRAGTKNSRPVDIVQ